MPAGTSPNKLVHAWNQMILDFPAERLKLLDELNKKRRIFLLSNTNELHLQAVVRSLANTTNRTLDSYFEKVYYSHLLKLRKPNKEIFDLVCKEQNLTVSDTIFIDDTIGHVDGAKVFGLQGVHLQKGITVESLFDFKK
jgi:putative hydrolase of the HAD superfamily